MTAKASPAKKAKTKPRASTPKQTGDSVLTKSSRVCALCWGFRRDGRHKLQGQIAHIDHARGNPEESNLAWLCLFCHDEYDGRKKQSMSIKPAELQRFKNQVEGLVLAGQLPSLQSNGGSLITVDLDHAAFFHHPALTAIEIYCLFANEGDRTTGIKRASLTRDGRVFAEIGFWSKNDSKGPLPRDEYSEDAENLHFLYDQVVEPGRVRRFVINFAPVQDLADIPHHFDDIEICFDPPLMLTIEPVLGGPISKEIHEMKYRREFYQP